MLHAFVEKVVQMLPARLQNTARQFVKFGVTGVIGAVVDFGSYNLMTRVFGWTTLYYVFGFELIAANMVSVLLAIFSNFLLNKYWTFRDRSEAVVRQGLVYYVFNLFTFALNQILTSFFAFRVPAIAQLFGNQKDNVAKALAIGVILFFNFAGSKFLIFRRQKPGAVQVVGPTTEIPG